MKQLNIERWKDVIKWEYEAFPFFTSVYLKLAETQSNKYFFEWNFLNYFSAGKLEGYISQKEFIEKGNLIIKELLSGNVDFLKQLKKTSGQMGRAMELCQNVKDIEDIKKWWVPTQQALSDSANLAFCLDIALNEYINKLSISDHEALESNIHSPKKSFITSAMKELNLLMKKNNDDIDKVHKEFIKKYSWFQNSYSGEFIITKEWLKNFYESQKNIIVSKNKKITLPEKFNLLAETASFLVTFKDDKKKLLLIAVHTMNEWLKNICNKKKLAYEGMKWLSFDEVILASEGNVGWINRAKTFSNMKKRYGLMTPSGYDDVTKEFFDKVKRFNLPKGIITEIKGLSANKGKVTAKVAVILNVKNDAHKLKDGEILVTPMTRPEFISLMQKASAFITDEGGITCHAAIISREMNKPCIVGTKNATKILKDGDLVEVDADKGIIKIIKSHEK